MAAIGQKPCAMEMNPPDLWIHHGIVPPADKMNDDDNAASVGRPSSRGNRSDRSSKPSSPCAVNIAMLFGVWLFDSSC